MRRTGPRLSRLSFIASLASVIAVTAAGLCAVTFAPFTSPAALAATSFNPVTGNQGFTVFVAGNATLNSTSVGGPVALDVAAQLGRPVPLVDRRVTAVLGADMPEAAVNENGDTFKFRGHLDANCTVAAPVTSPYLPQ